MAVIREMKITLGALVIPGPGTTASTDYHLHGLHRIAGNTTAEVVTFQFVVTAPDPASLAAECVLLELAFKAERQAITVELDGNESLGLDPALNTGFYNFVEFGKPGNLDPQYDSNTSRLYEITVQAELPRGADTDYLREFSYDVVYGASCRGAVSFQGVYTASAAVLPSPPGAAARGAMEVYNDEVASKVATYLTGLGGSWELVNSGISPQDDTDQVLGWSQTYRQIINNQSGSTLDHPDIVDPVMLISRMQRGIDSTDPSVLPLFEVTVSYACNVCWTSEQDLESVYENVIYPHVISQVSSLVGGVFAQIENEPGYDFDNNTIDANLSFLVAQPGTKFIQHKVEWTDRLVNNQPTNYQFVEQTPDLTGFTDLSPANVDYTHRVVMRTVVTKTINLGSTPIPRVTPPPAPINKGQPVSLRRSGGGSEDTSGFLGLESFTQNIGIGAAVGNVVSAVGSRGVAAAGGVITPPDLGGNGVTAILRSKDVKNIPHILGSRPYFLTLTERVTTEVYELVKKPVVSAGATTERGNSGTSKTR